MPVVRGDLSERPEWCELVAYRIVSLPPGGAHTWHAEHPTNKLVVVEGECQVKVAGGSVVVGSSGWVDATTGTYAVASERPTTFVELGGHWGDECGGAGVFGVAEAEKPGDVGDPVSYPKHTNFDRHYHDCDEYWILVSGRGTASSENIAYDVGPGDCVVTRMGHHHDFPLVEEPVVAVFFETTMRGAKRRGHLWEHTHGPARPLEG